MTRSQIAEIGSFVRNVGAPVAVLLIILGMIWFTGKSLHETVVVPVVSAHASFIQATQDTQERQAATLEVMAAAREQQTQILHEIVEGQHEIRQAIGELRDSR
jgi:FixJ family two-component response regulator